MLEAIYFLKTVRLHPYVLSKNLEYLLGYIIDVAAQIIYYETLYNLHSPLIPNKTEEENVYPKGIVSKLLKQVAFEDDGLIQYKAEVMLRDFEEQVKPLIDGKAKAMIVASSRIAGLKYYQLLKTKMGAIQTDVENKSCGEPSISGPIVVPRLIGSIDP